MTQNKPPDEVLYAFSQWLREWADYALSQTQQFTASTDSYDRTDGAPVIGSLHPPHEHQPPKPQIELAQPGPPAHWLALFEEYGMEPPNTGTPSGVIAKSDNQTPESASPHRLQDWLDEFQRGLMQFGKQQITTTQDLLSDESKETVSNPTQFIRNVGNQEREDGSSTNSFLEPGDEHLISRVAFTLKQDPDNSIPGQNFQDTAAFTATNPLSSTAEPGVIQDKQPPFHNRQRIGDGLELTAPVTPNMPANPSDPSLSQPKDKPFSTADSSEQNTRSFPNAEQVGDVEESQLSQRLVSSLHRAVFPLSKAMVADHRSAVDPARNDQADLPSPALQGQADKEASVPPVRLRLNPAPLVQATNEIASFSAEVEKNAQSQSNISKLVSLSAPRLHIGAPPSESQPPFVKPVDQSMLRNGQSVPPIESGENPESISPELKSDKPDLLPEIDSAPIHPIQIKQMNEVRISTSTAQEQAGHSSTQWSLPTTARWPELPESLPPVRLPSNVLSDTVHRMRVNREQKGRSWNI